MERSRATSQVSSTVRKPKLWREDRNDSRVEGLHCYQNLTREVLRALTICCASGNQAELGRIREVQ